MSICSLKKLITYSVQCFSYSVNITDVETDERCKCLQGNRDNKPLNSICWNERVNCLASVSDNCAKVWSTDGQPVRELDRNGCFRSRSFHPRYPNTLVIGRYEVSIFALYSCTSIVRTVLFLQNDLCVHFLGISW
ncbi:hypothetical protein PVAP13_9NG791966 [Panicum virgatum]|uniref:Uncharacterized protein n=1 Tax=Panicum virgatum TaxID=38727 RepID=A0A8T0N3Y0_PANVG|nr:hypothetical protein PVAP13_9NG791966 [Panicum virgatum]